jgi:hypothetical protein
MTMYNGFTMKVLIHLKSLLLVLILFLFIAPSQSVAYTLDDFSIVGTGNINGFNSEFFSLTATEPITTKSGGTSTSSGDLTFTNLSSIDIDTLIITFDGMAPSTVIQNGGLLETSPGSGVYLNYVSYGGLTSGDSLTTQLSLTAAGNSSEGQMTSAKFNIYTIPNIVGPSASTPEPSTYLLIILALLFSTTLVLRKRSYDFIGK